MDVIFSILDRISLKYVGKVIADIATPFALENELDLDQCLKKYIQVYFYLLSIYLMNHEFLCIKIFLRIFRFLI